MDAVLTTLHQNLVSCAKLIVAGDYATSEQSIAELVKNLNAISESLIAEEPQYSQELAVEILTQIHQYVATPALGQEIIDALAFELPKAVARFACVSDRCLEVAEGVVDLFVERCSPREMLSILLEAISSLSDPFMLPVCFIPLLTGLTKVIVLIQRRIYEQVKHAVPIILNVLTTLCLKRDDEDTDYEKLFSRTTGIASSIRTISVKLEGEDNSKLKALLGLYALQIMALVSHGMASDKLRCRLVVLQLSDFLPHCDLSYIGLVTGCEVDMISKLVIGDDGEVGVDCFSQVKLGAALAVIWGFGDGEIALAAKADMTSVLMELKGNWTRRWEAVGMLKYLFSYANMPWGLKRDGISFIACIMDGITTNTNNEFVDYSLHMPTMYTSLQVVTMVIMYTPETELRKKAFITFKKMLADIPTPWRFDVLMALIKNSNSPSMIGILIDCVREEMRLELVKRNASVDSLPNSEVSQSTSFWNQSVLQLVEMVLKPPEGGPPSLPEDSDAVLSALNLYRFILITESTGNSNSSGILAKEKLQKVYKEWLLPLRVLVSGTMARSMKESDDSMCALNPVELVLYRCIELVEEKLKHL
ncbi:aberrant root formation protein 4-like [Salvia splendens]|uniref:aberrant root formation protein 4-like n=1 Tax=Salvia splendens TaxID=180675 RepID=UPI001C26DC5C|nr:aberrant root formation protein 4-like [Salvia splendens]